MSFAKITEEYLQKNVSSLLYSTVLLFSIVLCVLFGKNTSKGYLVLEHMKILPWFVIVDGLLELLLHEGRYYYCYYTYYHFIHITMVIYMKFIMKRVLLLRVNVINEI